MKSAAAFVLAAVSAYSFSFAADLLIGGLVGAYPSTSFLPVVTWAVIAAITGGAAFWLAQTGRFLVVPFVVFGLLALVGGMVGHHYNLGVAALMLAEAGGVWLATTRTQHSESAGGLAH